MRCFLLIAFFFSIACSHQESPPPPTPQWQSQMHGMADTMTELIPYMTNESKFTDPANASFILQRVSLLKSFSHIIKDSPQKPDKDPGMNYISTELSEELQRALDAFKGGRKEYSRHVLKGVSSYCIECHTRHSYGPQFTEKINNTLSQMQAFDRAEYYASTRHFESSLSEYEKIISTGNNNSLFDVIRSTKKALFISVRMMQSPDKTQEVITSIEKNKNLPPYMQAQARDWKNAVKQWKKEKASQLSTHSLLTEAKRLIQKSQKETPQNDNSGMVELLRAQSKLNEILAYQNPKASEKSEVLFLLGQSIEITGSFNIWNLHEKYYEECIKNTPHTTLAQKCFKQLEESVLMGYSGSQGLSIPSDEQERLTKLRAESTPL